MGGLIESSINNTGTHTHTHRHNTPRLSPTTYRQDGGFEKCNQKKSLNGPYAVHAVSIMYALLAPISQSWALAGTLFETLPSYS